MATETEFLITSCPDHGVKVVGDFASFKEYVATARLLGKTTTPDAPDAWECCERMVIDPYGILDH